MSGNHQEARGCGCGGHASAGGARRDWASAGPGQVVCPCLGLDKAAILRAIRDGAFTLPLLKVMTGAGRGADCARSHSEGHSCEADLLALLALYAEPPSGWPLGGCGH